MHLHPLAALPLVLAAALIVPGACAPGESCTRTGFSYCQGNEVWICVDRELGSSYLDATACPETTTCVEIAGQPAHCVDAECLDQPVGARCEGDTRIECSGMGKVESIHDCLACSFGDCEGGLDAHCNIGGPCLDGLTCAEAEGVWNCRQPCTCPSETLCDEQCDPGAFATYTDPPYNTACIDGWCAYR